MSRPRLPFLPTFLTILAIAFGVTLVARIRSYNTAAAPGRDSLDASSTISGASPTLRRPSSSAAIDPVADGANTAAQIGQVSPAGNPRRPASATQESRAQKLRELLNAPPPPKAAGVTSTPAGVVSARPVPQATTRPGPQPPQSAFAKGVQAVKDFFTGNSSASAQVPAPQPTQRPPNDNKNPPVEKDPSTDTTPPQVMQVQFDPPQIQDGDSSNVIVTAVDDLSGVRGISGTVTSPTAKALQGFACQRESPESNRYIGRVTIPKDAEEGLWHINFLNVSDNASNSITLSFSQSPVLQAATLKVVSSRPDNTPPTIKNVWIDRRAMRAGEKNTLFVQAVDDKSGVNLVSGVFLSPSKLARIGVACRPGDADVWACEFSAPLCLDCGDWQLEQIQLQDKASNMGAVRTDNPLVAAVKVNIMGDSCDSQAPTLQSVVMETNSVPSGPDGTFVNVRLTVTDDVCGVSSVSAQVVGPSGGSGQFFSFQPAGDPTWVGHMPIPRLAGKGIWKINWVQVMDKGNNLRVYYAGDPLLQNAYVTVR